MVYNSEEVKDPSFIILEDDVLSKIVFKKSDGSTLVVPLADITDVESIKSALSGAYVQYATGANDDDTTDNRAYLNGLVDAAAASGVATTIILPPTKGRYAWSGTVHLDVPGLMFICHGAPCRQLMNGEALFDVSAPDVLLDGLDAIGAPGAPNVTGMTAAWEGSITASRWTAVNVYATAHRLRIPWIRGRGSSSVVRISGWDPVLGAPTTGYVEDVEIGTLLCSNVEFGMSGKRTKRLRVGRVSGSYGQAIGSPRAQHIFYLAGTDADHLDISLGDFVAEAGANGHAFQIKGAKGGSVGSLQARNCPGLLMTFDCIDVDWGPQSSTGDTYAGVDASFTMQATVSAHHNRFRPITIRMASNGPPIRVISGDDNTFSDVEVEVNHTTTGASTAFDIHIAGNRNTLNDPVVNNIGALSWRAIGTFSGTGHRIRNPRCTNVRVGVDSRNTNTQVEYDADQITLHATDGLFKTSTEGSVASGAKFRSPQNAHLHHPRIVVADDFSLPTASTSALKGSISGHLWEGLSGTWNIASGRAYESVGGTNSAVVIDSGLSDASISVGFTSRSSEGLVFRATDASNYLFTRMHRSAPGVQLLKRVAGVNTVLATFAITPGLGRRFGLEVQVFGALITIYLDGVVILTHTLTGGDESTFAAQTKHGLFESTSTTARFDNFAVRSLV